ncbi:MAG TPA: carbohydrate ABC transporter permease [Candidatus Cloacimonadota bacterium]|nr:carbohydrate ABC transporter permease [Candidatus Cloacimonadota bacterium]HPT72330.1 carbohydrate ABC transporter permease [Candidatus Cloacimonadota bacterium]
MKWFKSGIIYIILLACGLSMIVPFLWMITTSLKSQTDVNEGNVGFIPIDRYQTYTMDGKTYRVQIVLHKGSHSIANLYDSDGNLAKEYQRIPNSKIQQVKKFKLHWENFKTAFQKVPFARYFINTIYVAIITLFGVLITSALAAYAFARMQFFGREWIFILFISMMMVPEPVFMIPSYILLDKLGWIDSYNALIIPWLANIFTIFLFRQHFKSIPAELFDAAAIDGCTRFGMLWRIVLPLSKPVIATASIFSVIGSWNSFMWPLVMTNSEELRVLQVGLSYFSQEASSQTTLLMAASTFSILPLVILFLFAQKQIIASAASTGMKD